MNRYYGQIWKETFFACIKVLPRRLSIEQKNITKRRKSDKIACNLVETLTGYIQNSSLKSYTYMKLLGTIQLRQCPYTLQQNKCNALIMEIRYRI
jgi:hypothetical protein